MNVIGKSTRRFLPTAWPRSGRTWHVAQAHPQADDRNPGNVELPFRTIGRAAAAAAMGDTVVIGAGVYREEVALPHHAHHNDPAAIIAFRAEPDAEVYLKGSDIFDAAWQRMAAGIFSARLPAALFADGAYNPYALSAAAPHTEKVRPCPPATRLPETLGQLYLDDATLTQVSDMDALQREENSFLVAADGRQALAHFGVDAPPPAGAVELSMRRRCFRPAAAGTVFIGVTGISVKHAAEPEAFALQPPLILRDYPQARIHIRKTFNLPGTTPLCIAAGLPAYRDRDGTDLIAFCADDTCPGPGLPGDLPWRLCLGRDHGREWQPLDMALGGESGSGGHFFLDREHNALIRYYRRWPPGEDAWSQNYLVMWQFSRDGGQSWNAPAVLDRGKAYHRMIKLRNGEILAPFQEKFTDAAGRRRHRSGVQIGRWRPGLDGLDWQRGGLLEIGPAQSSSGLCEPSICQFPDGRLFAIMRQQGAVLPEQNTPGFPSVKFRAVSGDQGRTWSAPAVLVDEDGKYVYSPHSWPEAIFAGATGKPYLIINAQDYPSVGCDPRLDVWIMELDMERLCVRRAGMALLETRHPEHHALVRYSNWQVVENHHTGNWLLFMRLSMSEHCPVRHGYDYSSYRYEMKFG